MRPTVEDVLIATHIATVHKDELTPLQEVCLHTMIKSFILYTHYYAEQPECKLQHIEETVCKCPVFRALRATR